MSIRVSSLYDYGGGQSGGLENRLSYVLSYDLLPIEQLLYIFPKGCLSSNGSHDCHAACRNIAQVMENAATLANCLSYPIISQATSLNDLTVKYDGPYAADYNIIANDSARDVITSIQGCLSDYCVRTETNCGRSSDQPSTTAMKPTIYITTSKTQTVVS